MNKLKVKRKKLNKSLLSVSSILISSVIITGCFDKKPNDFPNPDKIAKAKELIQEEVSKSTDKIYPILKETSTVSTEGQLKRNEDESQNQNINPNPSNYKLISLYNAYVVDGDTVHGYDNANTKIKVRMLGIDAPESSQAMGKESKASLEQCVSHSPDITLLVDSNNVTDRYGRYLAIVNSGNIDCNLYQVEQGMAYFYKQYADGLPADKRPVFDVAERGAQQNKMGVWSQNLERPWDYRKNKRN